MTARSRWGHRFPALFVRDIHAVTPMVDQIEAAQKPANVIKRWSKRRNKLHVVARRDFSPQARWHPAISAALDEAKLIKTTVAPSYWYEQAGLTYTNSNLPDRKSLEALYPPDMVIADDFVGFHDLAATEPLDSDERVVEFRMSLEAASSGPFGQCVVLIDPRAPRFAPPIPECIDNDERGEPSVVAFPVPVGFSVARVSRFALEHASRCRWCGFGLRGINDWGLLVSAGATVYVFGTCADCRSRLEGDFNEKSGQLDFETCDGFDRAAGYPADDWR